MLRSIISKMKKAAQFLKYPLLQYIPISLTSLYSNSWHDPLQSHPEVLLFQNHEAFQTALHRFGESNLPAAPAGMLYVICLNFKAELVLFRYLTCKIIGQEQPGSLHAFYMTKKYFPRRTIHFVLCTDRGEKLRSINEEIY
ncbi:MAG: hypothetical protein GX357_08405 [Firmicutes bacterium]|nr:hypothetical protein [Bacillota bacterium]